MPAARGMEIMLTMCIWRHSSHSVVRYAQQAPLATITDTFKLLAEKSDGDQSNR